ncbi:hypothetical protein DFR86_00700 [Acidianus sulfidivorans JP7]|uniref:Thermopsin n=1 Tax=Acidianus sulfidivorans JP7 TaxID=619593 RepID=A0A2U9IJJ8_9CREN|nr:hypothetical protein [Acidianus sulfidivorans]AWR96209.1 hypothetical protein DFR86_00700 [Acidianus sulfidivorans JP7]
MKSLVYVLAFLMVFALIPISFSSSTNSPTIHVYYQRYDSIYTSASSILNSNVITYTVSSAVYNETLSQGKAFHVMYNRTTYLLYYSSSAKEFEGNVNISLNSNDMLSIKTNLPNLIRVLVTSANETEVVWAGFNSSDINTYAYINESGEVTLQFANGSTVANETFSIKTNSSVSENVSLYLQAITSMEVKSSFTGELTSEAQLPRRYSPLFVNVNYNGTESNTTINGYSVTTAYFNGEITPALVWKGEGTIGISMYGNMFITHNMNVDFETIEFYGVNGTVLGYVHIASVTGSFSLTHGMLANVYHSVAFSEIKVVTVSGVKPIHAELMGYVYVNGVPVIVASNYENVTSTAFVNISHLVVIHSHKGVLVELNLNSTSKFVVLAQGNVTYNVTTVTPISVNITNVIINGNAHIAQKIEIGSNVSQYILFNVTVYTNSSIIGVYKVVNGHLVELNSSNYFFINGKLEVFDDPSSTYYVVYSAQPVTTTTTTTSSTTSSSTTTTSSSTTSTTSSTSTSSSTSSTVIPVSTSSTTTSSSSLIYAAIGIIVVIIVIVAVLLMRRK